MKSLLFIALLVVLFSTEHIHGAIQCRNDSCDVIKCDNATPETCNKPNQDIRKGGFCNCCQVCYTTLAENEKCSSLLLLGGPPPTIGCGKGLECKDGVCVKA